MAISTQMVRELRDLTGAGMMDCKKALEAANGSIEAAIDHLRKAGMKSAGKKAQRETTEGRVFAVVTPDRRRGHLAGVACETDFLAKGENFGAFVRGISDHVAARDPSDAAGLLAQGWRSGGTVADAVREAVGQFGENIRIAELARLENAAGRIGSYVHHDNKQGAIVSVTTDAPAGAVGDVLKSLCQHIVVFLPAYATREDVPADVVEHERAVLRESDEVKKKPAELRNKIVEGKLAKFYAGCVLEEQPWIHDDGTSVRKALQKALGPEARVQAFRRVRLGG
ncbi:MAG: translation elongation factor Ts [Planctomycetota bacterium]